MVSKLSQYEHINTNDTFNLVSGTALLKKVVINDVGSDWLIKIYDDTGTGTSDPVAEIAASQNATLEYNVKLKTGLTVVTSGTTEGSATVLFEGE